MLEIILNITKEEGQVQGVVPNLVEDGFSILQYAYDTVVFITTKAKVFPDGQKLSGMLFLAAGH
jgi:hypothetical protein